MSDTHRFANDAVAVRAARQFVLGKLSGCPPALLEVAELLVSELATNCVRHTSSDFEVSVSVSTTAVRVAVNDLGDGSPEVQRLDPFTASGRGLALVEMLSSSWGVIRSASAAGKTVWFALEVGGE